jgi:hypothetical protein
MFVRIIGFELLIFLNFNLLVIIIVEFPVLIEQLVYGGLLAF